VLLRRVEIEVRGEPLEMGLLSLRKLPALFRRAGKRVHVVEKRKCSPYQRRRVSRIFRRTFGLNGKIPESSDADVDQTGVGDRR